MFRLLLKKLEISLFITLLATQSGCGKKEVTLRPPPRVQTKTVEKKNVEIWLDTVGNVRPNLTVSVTPQVGGLVESVFVKEGQRVNRGDLLYVIDPRPYEAQLTQAQGVLIQDRANLAYQKQRYERYSKLAADDFISKINIEEIESAILQAEGAVEKDEGMVATAKINLDWCYIRSPIDGKISKYDIDIGNVVTPNDQNSLTVIRQITPIQVQFSYTQREFEEIQEQFSNKQFEFEVSLLKPIQDRIKGNVYFFDNTININTGTILLKGLISNEDERLWPGEFVRVGMLLKEEREVLTVPLESVDKGQEGFFVFTVNDSHMVKLRQVRLGRQVGQEYIILEGVQEGEQVITIGQLNVQNGMKVIVDNQIDLSAEDKAQMQLRI